MMLNKYLLFLVLLPVSMCLIVVQCDDSDGEDDGDCYEEGESRPELLDAPDCCEGLDNISCEKPDESGECPGQCVGGTICAKCGDSVCGKGENYCNCSEDCAP